MSSRTPETLTAAQRAQRLNLKTLTPPPIDPAPQPISEQEPMIATKTPSKQEQKTIEQARKSLPPIGGGRTSATANMTSSCRNTSSAGTRMNGRFHTLALPSATW